jgi:hypothetical protein
MLDTPKVLERLAGNTLCGRIRRDKLRMSLLYGKEFLKQTVVLTVVHERLCFDVIGVVIAPNKATQFFGTMRC